MARYALRRMVAGAIQVLVVSLLAFLLVEALPGDAAVVMAGDNPDPVIIERVRIQMHLDDPAALRFWLWVSGLATGDMGTSLVSGREVALILAAGAEPTATLAGLALMILLPVAVLLGVAAALYEGRTLDRVITALIVSLYAVPEFALALLLVAVFAIYFAWLPPTAVGVDSLLAEPAVLVLPLIVLLARPVCSISRLVRAGMVEALHSDYVEHMRRIGLPGRAVVLRHALPNAVAPAVAQIARTTDWLLGGVIVTEAVFVIPGLGTELVNAVSARDLPVIQGLAVLFALTTVTVNLLADLAAFRLAPRAEVHR